MNSKKKIDDILLDKNEIIQAINKLKQYENVVTYYYCKDDKMYYLFEYSLTPTIRKDYCNSEINIDEIIDSSFSLNLTIETIRDIVLEPKKYINFDPRKNTIKGNSILTQLIIFNEEKLLTDVIEKFKVQISDNNNGVKYHGLLDLAMKTNNGNIVNILNKCYYENKIEKMEKIILEYTEEELSNKYKKFYDWMIKINPIINCILVPIIFYSSFFSNTCQ
jgi:hypothetical protein